MKILRPDPNHPIRKRLWQASLAIALIMAVVVAHEAVVRLSDGSHQLSLGEDFLPAYAAGTLVREGRSSELYAIEPMARIERQVVAQANLEPLPVYGPFLNPPFFAALYAPLSALPYRQAAGVWLVINLLLLCGSIAVLRQMLPRRAEWRAWGLVPLILVLPVPFWQAMCHQQNTFLSLILLSTVVLLWKSGAHGSARAQVLAGLVAGMLFYKPQLACAVTMVLVITLGWRALAGTCATGLALLSFTLLAMPGTISSYLHQLPPTVRWIQTVLRYNWGRQVTAQSFWRLLFQGHAPGPTHWPATWMAGITMLAVGAALLVAVWRFIQTGARCAGLARRVCLADPLAGRDRQRPASGAAKRDGIIVHRNSGIANDHLDRLIGATIASMPLLMPYYMDYDLLLLAVPAVLLAAEWIRAGHAPGRGALLLLWAWIALFLAMYLSTGLAGRTRVNLAVPLIGLVAGVSIARCLRHEPAQCVAAASGQTALAAAA